MIKLVYCLRKRSHLSDEEFRAYWKNVHSKIGTAMCAKENVLRYVQSHKVDTELNDGIKSSRGLGDPYDGIAELWWKDVSTVRADLENPDLSEDFEKLLADEGNFIDFSKSCAFFTEEFNLYEAVKESGTQGTAGSS